VLSSITVSTIPDIAVTVTNGYAFKLYLSFYIPYAYHIPIHTGVSSSVTLLAARVGVEAYGKTPGNTKVINYVGKMNNNILKYLLLKILEPSAGTNCTLLVGSEY